MPRLGGSRYADLTKPQGVTPVYWPVRNKSLSPREEGWEILKLNCYKLSTLTQVWLAGTADELSGCNMVSLLAMDGANKFMGHSLSS